MKVETKFEVGQQVVFFHDNILYRRPVNRIEITLTKQATEEFSVSLIIYWFVMDPDSNFKAEAYKYESEVALTKEELIAGMKEL